MYKYSHLIPNLFYLFLAIKQKPQSHLPASPHLPCHFTFSPFAHLISHFHLSLSLSLSLSLTKTPFLPNLSVSFPTRFSIKNRKNIYILGFSLLQKLCLFLYLQLFFYFFLQKAQLGLATYKLNLCLGGVSEVGFLFFFVLRCNPIFITL